MGNGSGYYCAYDPAKKTPGPVVIDGTSHKNANAVETENKTTKKEPKFKNLSEEEVGKLFEDESIFSREIEESDKLYYVMSDAIKEDKYDSRNGKIDKKVKQGYLGNCGLDSAVLAMSVTDAGEKHIEDSFLYSANNSLMFLPCVGYETVSVTKQDKWEKGDSSLYSQGDVDMKIIELAIEQEIDKILNGTYEICEDAPFEIKILETNDISNKAKQVSSTEGMYPLAAFYLLTGKVGEYIFDRQEMSQKLNEFQENDKQDLAMTAVTNFKVKDDKKAPETDDGEIYKSVFDFETKEQTEIPLDHAFAVKDVTDTVVTLLNPWDTSKTITLSRCDFLDNFYIMSCDLSEDNPERRLIYDASLN